MLVGRMLLVRKFQELSKCVEVHHGLLVRLCEVAVMALTLLQKLADDKPIWTAHHEIIADEVVDCRDVAAKLFSRSCRRSARQELAHMNSVHSPFVIEAAELISFRDDLALIMPKYHQDLHSFVERALGEDALSLPRAVRISAQMLLGVVACHDQGISHRDIKLENFLCDAAADRIVLCDFGSATKCDIGQDRRSFLVSDEKGTKMFMAPEVQNLRPGSSYNPFLADSWSLGVAIVSMLTGYGVSWSRSGRLGLDRSFHSLPDDCQDFLYSLLKFNSRDRSLPHDLLNHPWLRDVVHELRRATPERIHGQVGPQPTPTDIETEDFRRAATPVQACGPHGDHPSPSSPLHSNASTTPSQPARHRASHSAHWGLQTNIRFTAHSLHRTLSLPAPNSVPLHCYCLASCTPTKLDTHLTPHRCAPRTTPSDARIPSTLNWRPVRNHNMLATISSPAEVSRRSAWYGGSVNEHKGFLLLSPRSVYTERATNLHKHSVMLGPIAVQKDFQGKSGSKLPLSPPPRPLQLARSASV